MKKKIKTWKHEIRDTWSLVQLLIGACNMPRIQMHRQICMRLFIIQRNFFWINEIRDTLYHPKNILKLRRACYICIENEALTRDHPPMPNSQWPVPQCPRSRKIVSLVPNRSCSCYQIWQHWVQIVFVTKMDSEADSNNIRCFDLSSPWNLICIIKQRKHSVGMFVQKTDSSSGNCIIQYLAAEIWASVFGGVANRK
jgi:hypothetical protein